MKETEQQLMNWGRYVKDNMASHGLLFSVLPTSEGYLAPIVAYDEPEPAKTPIDEIEGQITEDIVVKIGVEPGGFDSYRVLVHWYTRLMMHHHEEHLSRNESIKRLSKHMRCSFLGAERMLEDARNLYRTRRLQHRPQYGKIIDGP